jgi:heat-inducible transcriptional repressor
MYIIANFSVILIIHMDQPKELTPRQIQILKAIIEEYITTALPVGSETLDKKYNLGISPATIRNEMVRLTDMKFLHQPHTSAGRSPTPTAMRYYVEQLMRPHDMSVTDEVAVKEKIWDYRQEVDKLLREATKTLAERTKVLALTATKEGDLYYAGAANILDMPEFYDYELTHRLFETLDRYDFWWTILKEHENIFDIVLGDDMGQRGMLSQCGFIYARFTTPHVSGAIGVVGPSRLNYSDIVPVVRYMGGLIDEFAAGL